MSDILNIIWIILLIQIFIPLFQKRFLAAKRLGIMRNSDQMPEEIYQFMDLYPKAKQQRPGVEFIPVPYRSPGVPGKGEK